MHEGRRLHADTPASTNRIASFGNPRGDAPSSPDLGVFRVKKKKNETFMLRRDKHGPGLDLPTASQLSMMLIAVITGAIGTNNSSNDPPRWAKCSALIAGLRMGYCCADNVLFNLAKPQYWKRRTIGRRKICGSEIPHESHSIAPVRSPDCNVDRSPASSIDWFFP